MCLAPESPTTPEETIENIKKGMDEFFGSEELSLSYSRKRCTEYLKKALCRVFLAKDELTTRVMLKGTDIEKTDPLYHYLHCYLSAMEYIYNNIAKHAQGSENELETINNLIDVANELVENLSLCIVVTNKEDDANKLFEVLNDRALEMEDLELIKNHFYKEYCTKSGETNEETIDNNIEKLDTLWVEKVFTGLGEGTSATISYFAATYLSS